MDLQKLLKTIGKSAFPTYKGRKFRHDASGKCYLSDLNWDGGSRSVYKAVRLEGMQVLDGPTIPAPWANPYEGKAATVPEGFAIVEHAIFCGKDAGLTIYTAGMPALGLAS